MNVNVDTIQPVDSQAVRQAVQEHYAAVVSGSSTCCGDDACCGTNSAAAVDVTLDSLYGLSLIHI